MRRIAPAASARMACTAGRLRTDAGRPSSSATGALQAGTSDAARATAAAMSARTASMSASSEAIWSRTVWAAASSDSRSSLSALRLRSILSSFRCRFLWGTHGGGCAAPSTLMSLGSAWSSSVGEDPWPPAAGRRVASEAPTPIGTPRARWARWSRWRGRATGAPWPCRLRWDHGGSPLAALRPPVRACA